MKCLTKASSTTRLGSVLQASALVLFMACGSAKAGLLGDTVNVTYNYPTVVTVEEDFGDQVVTPGLEYASMRGFMSLDVSDGNLRFTVLQNFGYVNGPFNGYILTDLSNADIVGASINSETTAIGLAPGGVTFDSRRVLIDMEWMGFLPGQIVSIDIRTRDVPAVPEPESYVLILVGLGVVGAAVARRKGACACRQSSCSTIGSAAPTPDRKEPRSGPR